MKINKTETEITICTQQTANINVNNVIELETVHNAHDGFT